MLLLPDLVKKAGKFARAAGLHRFGERPNSRRAKLFKGDLRASAAIPPRTAP
jgi:hypothetical protein